MISSREALLVAAQSVVEPFRRYNERHPGEVLPVTGPAKGLHSANTAGTLYT